MTNVNRNRGYTFENSLTKRINSVPGWTAWRLGGSQIALPDVVAVHPETKYMEIYELKSTIKPSKIMYVQRHQIERCMEFGEPFSKSFDVYITCGFRWGGRPATERFLTIPLKELEQDIPDKVSCSLYDYSPHSWARAIQQRWQHGL